MENRSETKRDCSAQSKEKSISSWAKVWKVSSFINMAIEQENTIWRKAVDNNTNLQARQSNNMETYAANI